MEISVARDIDKSRKNEKELEKRLKQGGYQYTSVEGPLVQIRAACSDALLADYKRAQDQNAEERLWDSHQKVNNHYRTALTQFKKATESKPVEQRKLGAEYLKFIKSSQKFYRGFVGRLAKVYGDIPALQRVAKKLGPSDPTTATNENAVQPGPLELEQCCHRILIHLGDLSRYRESELKTDEKKDWAHATGYYNLALAVCPGSGQPFNQHAIIALADRSHFRASYYTYRSLTAEDPYPQAQDNLRRVMNMIQKTSQRRSSGAEHNGFSQGGMVDFFNRLVEQSSQGIESKQRDELEKEVVTQLKDHTLRGTAEKTPYRLVLTGIAAQHVAQMQFESQPDNTAFKTAYVLFLQLNLKAFLGLLQVLAEELEKLPRAKPVKNALKIEELADLLAPPVTRVLPLLRLYSSWLSKTVAIIVAGAVVGDHLQEDFWSVLARCLTGANHAFSIRHLPEVHHLLEEDEDTLGFVPLQSPENNKVWYDEKGLKVQWHDTSNEDRDIAKETLFRIRDFVLDGLRLTCAEPVPAPLSFDIDSGAFQSVHSPLGNMPQDVPRQVSRRSPQVTKVAASLPKEEVIQVQSTVAPQTLAASTEQHQDLEAERMVESIVGLCHDGDDEAMGIKSAIHDGLPTQHPTEPSTFGATSSFQSDGATVMDVMQKFFPRQVSPRGNMTNAGGAGPIARPNSRLQSPVRLVQPQRVPSHDSDRSNGSQRAIWETPRSDQMLHGLGEAPNRPLQNFSPSTAVRSSPLPPPYGHSRVSSNDGQTSIWTPDAASPTYKPDVLAPAMSRSSSARNLNLGNGTFGNGAFGIGSATGDFAGTESTFNNSVVGGPQTPWDAGYRAPQRLSTGSAMAAEQGYDMSGSSHSPLHARPFEGGLGQYGAQTRYRQDSSSTYKHG